MTMICWAIASTSRVWKRAIAGCLTMSQASLSECGIAVTMFYAQPMMPCSVRRNYLSKLAAIQKSWWKRRYTGKYGAILRTIGAGFINILIVLVWRQM